ncbi:putative methyltransferase protein [Rosellinia necatrix]|uniref:Putative methyltransferase protein n=1 Tax=Rosellinia necatrix TaxID=77044 RepID=A0A1S7UIS3_ROSNE|nr:putative methyltransferase protein [Rosellinia necatrix]
MASDAAAGPPENIKERLKASYDAMAATYNARAGGAGGGGGGRGGGRGLAFLELGCGCGQPVSARLLSHGGGRGVARLVANDLSSTQLALARANLIPTPDDDEEGEGEGDGVARRLELVRGDMMGALAFADASFDLAVAFYSIVHLPRAEQEVLFGRLARWLRPGGYLVANFAEAEFESAVVDRWLGDDGGWMYWSAWGGEKTVEKLGQAGFEVVSADTVEDEGDATFVWVIARRLGAQA